MSSSSEDGLGRKFSGVDPSTGINMDSEHTDGKAYVKCQVLDGFMSTVDILVK